MRKNLDRFHEDVPADYYDQAIRCNFLQRLWHTQRFAHVKKMLDGINAEKILDVGCHGGRFTFEMSQKFPQSSLYGIDLSAEVIAFAEKKYPKMHFAVAHAEELPFESEVFDLVTCFEVMEHVDNPTEVIGEIKRVLKRNGNFIVLVPTENMLFRLIWFIWSRFGPGKIWQHTHVQEFVDHSLDRLLVKSGFEIVNRKVFLLGMLLLLHVRKR